jgi:Flp pilus assembly protein TadG
MTRSRPPEPTSGALKRANAPSWARFWRDARGGLTVIVALVIPALALLTCGAIDLAAVNADRSAMQDAADATALAMAKQLGVATTAGITARAQDYAMAQLGQISSQDQVTVTTTVTQSSVTVAINGKRASFFGNLLPPGGWSLQVQATASTVGELPLCVLASGASAPGDIQVENTSQMSAAKCLVQSNGDFTADSGANVTAALAQAVGTASGPITPTPQTGAPAITDPFASMAINDSLLGSLLCPLTNPLANLTAGLHTITPLTSTFCGDITIGANTTVNFLPGVYYFKSGALNMQSNSSITGTDVVLIFDDAASFNFQDNSMVTLSGRQSGTYAGFVIITTRTNTNTFTISSTNAKQLEGTIYIPDATLQVTGTGDTVNDQAAWTVIVAQALQLTGSPNLVINSNYAASNVPVPGGVGPNYVSGKVTLTK